MRKNFVFMSLEYLGTDYSPKDMEIGFIWAGSTPIQGFGIAGIGSKSCNFHF